MNDSTPVVAEPTPQIHSWMTVIDKMIDKNVGAELLSKVFEMQMAFQKEVQRKEFVEAFAAFKAEAPAAIERTGRVTAVRAGVADHRAANAAGHGCRPLQSGHPALGRPADRALEPRRQLRIRVE